MGAVTFMTGGVRLLMLAAPAYWALIQDVAPDSAAGSASGIMHGLGNTSGIVGPIITGLLIQKTGTFVSAFALFRRIRCSRGVTGHRLHRVSTS